MDDYEESEMYKQGEMYLHLSKLLMDPNTTIERMARFFHENGQAVRFQFKTDQRGDG